MKEIPILFSTPMVQAILEGRKSQTRRIVKPAPQGTMYKEHNRETYSDTDWGHEYKCPYGKTGDVLWVRETWRGIKQDFGPDRIEYKATETINLTDKWRPSIFMPKEAARIWLKVESVRVERLQDISEQDAIAEGIMRCERADGNGYGYFDYSGKPTPASYNWGCPIKSFQTLWESINGAASWKANPWLWVVQFTVLSTTGKPSPLTSK